METKTTNMFESMADMQKQAVETFTSATEQMQKNLFSPSGFDSDIFKKWYDSQMAFFNQNAENKTNGNPMEFFNTWMNNQLGSAKSWFDFNNNPFMKNMIMTDDVKKSYDQMLNMFNNWSSTMNTTYSEMLKNFNADSNNKNAFTGMFNNAEMYMKSFELWMPMFKSIQDKSFTPETFKQLFNAPLFKDMIDKMFNMQPDFMKNMNEEAKANMFKMMDAGKGMYGNMKNILTPDMPKGNEMFNNMFASYNNAYTNINNAFAPMMKMMTPGAGKQDIETIGELANEFNIFNMKNNQMQYMMYVTGLKAMEELADSIYNKIRNNEDVSDFTKIYSEWLNINDKTFVKLFETDEYSKMQSELNSFGMKLKRNIDLQMEKAMANLPVINRTEMDSLYKTINELKKRINVLEKQIDNDAAVAETETKPAPKKANKN